ncbi:MAG: pseudouridine synthase [Alphaproteobacteria bacterium]|nr:pseudouridine synthase [Alphaproteobacteria bacterium]MCZ6496150.1 pseudouridine synthase [Alphaproteobacteria bacterium]
MAGASKEPASQRIARRIARAGVCSRRDAERLITAGRVVVNGVVLTTPALNVGPKDTVTIDGTPLPAAAPVRLWRHHKRKGRITASKDPQGRPTVFDDLPPDMPRTITIGRLDFNTEGLLLLTNDGALARTLELPATGWVRRYRVRVHGPVDEAALAALAQGKILDGIRYGPVDAALERKTGSNAWLRVGLAEGKNREVRKLLNNLGLEVTRLIRVSFGPFQLGRLATGGCSEVPAKSLTEQLGGLLPGSASLPTATAARARARERAPQPAGRAKPRARHAHHRRTP